MVCNPNQSNYFDKLEDCAARSKRKKFSSTLMRCKKKVALQGLEGNIQLLVQNRVGNLNERVCVQSGASATLIMSQLPCVLSWCLGKTPERFHRSPRQRWHKSPLRGSLQSLQQRRGGQREPGAGHRLDRTSSSSSHDSDAFWTSGELQVKEAKLDAAGDTFSSESKLRIVTEN